MASEEADSSKPLKILVSGDVEGKLGDLYSKVNTIQKKAGQFDLLFCVGEFFGETEEENTQIDEFLMNPKSIPITTYIFSSRHSSRNKYFRNQSGYDLSPDKIIYLGSKGMFTARQGLSIIYLSGLEEKDPETPSKTENTFNLKDIESLEGNFERRKNSDDDCVDLLITNQWPKYIEKQSNQQLENGLSSVKFGSELVSYLAMKVKPRYHFSANQNVFFERIPYRNHKVLTEKEKHLTRFLALAKANKTNKPKFLYAFNIVPAKKLSLHELALHSATQTTDCPYTNSLSIKPEQPVKRKQSKENDYDEENSAQFFYDAEHIRKMNEINEKAMNEKKRRLEAKESKELEPCWFCLGGSKVERHYIVSVGDKAYLAYAKGAINRDHLLIIPIDHVQSTIHADEKLMKDIEKYKMALAKYFKSRNKCVLFYERNFKTKHMQIQVLALDADKSYLLKDAFFSIAKEQDVHLNEIPQFTNLKQVLGQNQSFYYLELPNEDEKTDDENKFVFDRYLSEIRSYNFPLNFGRDVIASELLLNMPERIDWKECVQPQDEEKQMSVDFRNSFKSFDPFN